MPIDQMDQENQDTAQYRAEQHAMFNMFTPQPQSNVSPRMHQDIGHIVDDSPGDHLNHFYQVKHPCANVAPFE